jgi:hypothetical protein
MDPRLQSSFIPKKSPSGVSFGRPRTINVLFLISLIILVVMGALAGGVYLLNQNESNLIAQDDSYLQKAQSSLSGSLISDLSRLDARINTAGQLLQAHKSISPLLSLLEQVTSVNIRYTDMTYSQGSSGMPSVSLNGIGKSYNSVSYQSDVFQSTQSFKNPIFSNVGLDDKGNVTFHIDTNLDPQLLLYKNSYNAQGQTSTGQNVQQVVPSQ